MTDKCSSLTVNAIAVESQGAKAPSS
jgi:hypothetical protein